MKLLALVIPFLAVSSAFASTEVTCFDRSDSDYMLSISAEGHQILEASLYNVDWGQRAEDHYQKAISQANRASSAEITLEDGTRLSIPFSVLDRKSGDVLVNGDNYTCN